MNSLDRKVRRGLVTTGLSLAALGVLATYFATGLGYSIDFVPNNGPTETHDLVSGVIITTLAAAFISIAIGLRKS